MVTTLMEISDLLEDESGVIETVTAGGSVLVTIGGVPFARLVPLGAITIEEAIVTGLASPARISVAELLEGIPEGPVTSDLSDVFRGIREENLS